MYYWLTKTNKKKQKTNYLINCLYCKCLGQTLSRRVKEPNSIKSRARYFLE